MYWLSTSSILIIIKSLLISIRLKHIGIGGEYFMFGKLIGYISLFLAISISCSAKSDSLSNHNSMISAIDEHGRVKKRLFLDHIN